MDSRVRGNGAVGERESEAGHLVDDEERHRFAAQSLQRLEEVLDHLGREAQRGLSSSRIEGFAIRPRAIASSAAAAEVTSAHLDALEQRVNVAHAQPPKSLAGMRGLS